MPRETSATSGFSVSSAINTSGAGTKEIEAIEINAPTLTACTTGACTWDGLEIKTAASSLATVTQYGIKN